MPGRPTNEPSNYFAFAKQADADTEGTTFTFLRHLDGTALELEEEVESVHEGGDGQEVGLRFKTAISMDGQAVAYERPEVGARVWAGVLGADVGFASSIQTGASLCNDHLATPTSSLPYYTVEQYFGDQIERVRSARFDGLTLEGEQGRPLKLTAAIVGGATPYRRDVASALTATRETTQPFFYPGASIVIDGAGNTKVTKFKMDVKRTLDKDIRTTELFREDVVALNFDTELEFTLKYEDKTLYDKVKYGSGSMIPVALATGAFKVTSVFGSGTLGRLFEAGCNVLTYTGARVNKLDPDGKTMYLDVTAMGIKSATHQVYARHSIASVASL